MEESTLTPTKKAANQIMALLRSRLTNFVAFTILLIVAFGAGMQYGQRRDSFGTGNRAFLPSSDIRNRQVPDKVAKNVDFAQFWEVWDLVSQQYFDKKAVNPEKMYYGAIQGMVAALGDPYTTFLPPTENKQVKDDLGGNFSGVGIELGFKDNNLVVIAPLDDTPAKAAGVLAGDYITKIDDKTTEGISLPEAVSKIRGPQGTKVTLELYRAGGDKPFPVVLTRQTIHVKSVTYTRKDTVGYIKLSRFGDETNNEWDAAVEAALHDKVKSVVVDVRNNPGGYLLSAIYIASDFINGPIVKQENADGSKQTKNADHTGRLLNTPVVVLLNKGSASASEIFAGAIRANNRGKLIGETSFGKGTIQEVQDLDKGAGIHITRARWLLPNDFWVHKVGLKPDIEASMSAQDVKDNKDPQLDKALEEAKKIQ